MRCVECTHRFRRAHRPYSDDEDFARPIPVFVYIAVYNIAYAARNKSPWAATATPRHVAAAAAGVDAVVATAGVRGDGLLDQR